MWATWTARPRSGYVCLRSPLCFASVDGVQVVPIEDKLTPDSAREHLLTKLAEKKLNAAQVDVLARFVASLHQFYMGAFVLLSLYLLFLCVPVLMCMAGRICVCILGNQPFRAAREDQQDCGDGLRCKAGQCGAFRHGG